MINFHKKAIYSNPSTISRARQVLALVFFAGIFATPAYAALNIPITVNLSESVNVTGTPQIAVDVGGTTRYATYTSGTGTNALTFTLAPQAGDVDLDGVTVASPIQLNGGTIKDTKGNNATLTFTPPNTANVKVNYPSLGMDFVVDADGRYTLNGTAYNDLSSFLTATGGSFTRASIGTYFDSAGVMQTAATNTPRFDYDPVTHAAKGILIEESRTNLLTRSAEIDTPSVWPPLYTTVISNSTLAPDGTISAEKWAEDTSNNIRYIPNSSITLIGNTTYTVSIFVKTAGRYNIALEILGFHGSYIGSSGCNISTITSTFNPRVSAIGNVDKSIQSFGNGWFRCSLTATTDSSSSPTSTPRVNLLFSNGGTYGSYTGDGTSGLYLWGAQLEAGAFPTSYIATTSAAVTRTADSLKIPTSGWYNSTEGTVYVHGGTGDTGATSSTAFFSFDDNTSNNRIQLRRANGTMKANMRIVTASTSVMDVLGPTVWTDSSIHDFAIAYKSSDNRYYMDGVYQSISISGSPMPSTTQLQIGYGTGSNYLDGPISKLKYYPARINNTQLQLLTQ